VRNSSLTLCSPVHPARDDDAPTKRAPEALVWDLARHDCTSVGGFNLCRRLDGDARREPVKGRAQ